MGMAVTVGVIAALGLGFALWRSTSASPALAGDAARVWVATEDAPAGIPARQAVEGALRQAVPLNVVPPRVLADAPPEGSVTARPLLAGQILTERDFAAKVPPALRVPPGHVAVAVDLPDAARVGRFVQPGSLVRMFGLADRAVGNVILERVLVLARGATTQGHSAGPTPQSDDGLSAASGEAASDGIITVAVRPADASRVLAAAARGELALGLLPEASVSAVGRSGSESWR